MLFHDHFQNFKVYQIPKAQLIIADVPYNLGNNAYASNPAWYKDGDNKNGESELAGREFFEFISKIIASCLTPYSCINISTLLLNIFVSFIAK